MELTNLKYKAYHHTTVYRTTTPQLYAVNRYHRDEKEFNRSKMGFWVGYNIFIDVDGTFTQTRLIGEETAANIGHNCDKYETCDTISICMALNGSKQVLNAAQEQTVRDLEGGKIQLKTINNTLVNIPELKLVRKFHREIQANRTCPGALITHEYMEGIISPNVVGDDIINGEQIRKLQYKLDRANKLVQDLLRLIVSLLSKK